MIFNKKRILFWLVPFVCGFLLTYLGFKFFRNFEEDSNYIEKEGVFWVVEFYENGEIKNQILADYVRKDIKSGAVACKDFYSDDLYIFSNRATIRDLSRTKDYIRFTTDDEAVK